MDDKLDPVQEEESVIAKGTSAIIDDDVTAEEDVNYDKCDAAIDENSDNGTVKREIHFSVGGSDGTLICLDEDDIGDDIDDLIPSPGSDDADTDDTDDDDDEWNKFEPSISDRLQIGYYRMDRASQTDHSELISLKKLSELLAITTVDIKSLKKNVYYAKLTLQAEYDGRLKDELTALQKRVTDKLAEIEKMHYEKIEVLRRSYKTQLANALCKLSCDYHRYYGKRDADSMEEHQKRVSDLEEQREEARKNEQREKDLSEMMRLQAEQAALDVVEESRSPTPESLPESNTKYLLEIEELNENMVKYEMKIDELENLLEETSEENRKMNHEVNKMTTRLTKEEDKTQKLKEQLSDLNQKLVAERYQAQERLNQQKDALKGEMDAKLNATRQKMANESSKQVEELKRKEAEKLHQMKMMEEKKMKELMDQKQEEVVVEVAEQPVLDHDTAALLQIQQSQKEEILTLQKVLNRKTKLWEMKIKMLQEHIHVLKDEMFLRSTLQRQSAKMKQAALTYTRHGARDVPLGVNPIDDRLIQRKHRLPTIVQSPSSNKVVGKGTVVLGGEVNVAQTVAAEFCKCK